MTNRIIVAALAALLSGSASTLATVCIVPNNGGTADLPPNCAEGYVSPDDVHVIIDGLPPGTQIIVDASHQKFGLISSGPGGNLGGEFEQFNSILMMNMTGTGALAGFNRLITIPLVCETHIGPRTPGDPVQDFATDMFRLSGELFGDPDFCVLRVNGGTDLGMPSPGHTTLIRQGPPGSNFSVDSFFDITYQIEFQGCPGSVLEGMGGVTTATIRMEAGNPGCGPTTDGLGCMPVACPNPVDRCVPHCANFDPATGASAIVDCQCRNPNDCQISITGGAAPVARGPANPCVVADDGSGTVTLPPPGCEYLSPAEVHQIIDGLPPGTTIDLAPIHKDFICDRNPIAGVCSAAIPPGLCEDPGGGLGGNIDCFMSTLQLQVTGTGLLAGFNRTLLVPVDCEVHTAPRTPGDPVQSFDTDMFRLQGEIFGDPDFCTFRVTGGSDLGLPSPGHTTLTQLPGGDFAVDSFFDITYQIEFQGCPGSVLDGMGGVTTATIHMETGAAPGCVGACPAGTTCVESATVLPDGTIDVCCDCSVVPTEACCFSDGSCADLPPTDCRLSGGLPQGPGSACLGDADSNGIDDACEPACAPTPDGSACAAVPCPGPAGDQCQPACVRVDPVTGVTRVTDCNCGSPNDCHVDLATPGGAGGRGLGNPCVVPDNMTGTITLPPAGCDYLSPDQVHEILTGLPAGATIELAAIHKDFICDQAGITPPCSQVIPPGLCEDVGGTLGGNVDCFLSTLQLQVTGTGALAGFNRTLFVPAACEVHTGPRTPGDPVQTFPNEMFRLDGQLGGDPDFCTLHITAGSDFGLPSPGQTTLNQLPSGDFAVDSFFDITYEIDFTGCPGSVLEGMAGVTTGSLRMETGTPIPACIGACPPNTQCNRTVTQNADGTIDVCCTCDPIGPTPGDCDGDGIVGSADYTVFAGCLTGPNGGPVPAGCECADLDNDNDVDLGDFALFQVAYTGP